MAIHDADQALEIYAKIRETRRFAVEVIGRGKPLTLRITVRWAAVSAQG